MSLDLPTVHEVIITSNDPMRCNPREGSEPWHLTLGKINIATGDNAGDRQARYCESVPTWLRPVSLFALWRWMRPRF